MSSRWRFTVRFQALDSARDTGSEAKRREPRHWRAKTLISISAWLSQLACLGVWWMVNRLQSFSPDWGPR